MGYEKRLTAPAVTNNYYRHTSAGGLNSCILISNGSVLPNCVGYAWGRAYELMGKAPKLSRGNAENWWGYNDGYTRSQTPRIGSIICWRKGQAGNGNDGAGHVGVVEEVASDGTITISQSAYGGSRFYISKMKKPYSLGGNYVLQGFIYLPIKVDTPNQQQTGNKLTLPSSATSWNVYRLGVAPVVGNECGKLNPSKFGGLTYDILRWAQKDVAVINTRDFGEVQIYIAKSTGAIIEEKKPVNQKPSNQTLYLPKEAAKWRIYPTNKAPVTGNEIGYLYPSKFGGLQYEILGNPQPNVVTIQTRDYGKVNIYVGKETGAVIK